MASGQNASRAERFAEFLRRLGDAPTASSSEEAYRQLCDVLNAVEDEMTSIPFDLANWQTDGRLYPPQVDKLSILSGPPEVKKYRTRGHHILIGENGAIEIRTHSSGRTVFSKPGGDGKTVY
jgi:hypothetical protein